MNVGALVARLAPYTADFALALSVLGMVLVVAGVITSGLFLPGVVLIAIGLLKFAAAALFSALGYLTPRSE